MLSQILVDKLFFPAYFSDHFQLYRIIHQAPNQGDGPRLGGDHGSGRGGRPMREGRRAEGAVSDAQGDQDHHHLPTENELTTGE